MKAEIETHINIPENLAKVRNKELWTFALNDWHRLLSPYVPFETGTLDNSVKIKAELMGGEIEYFAPYAHYMYEGKAMGPNFYDPDYGFWSPPGEKKEYTGKALTYSTARHPLATAHWDKAAEPHQKPKLIQSMQAYVDSGRLNLSE